jgi:hypothetical protein
MSHFEKMIDILKEDSSYDTILKNMINVFSPYFLCDHFIGNEAWRWGVLSKIPPGKNDINTTFNLDAIKEYDIVQCQLKFFDFFVCDILPLIKKKIVLITSQFEYEGFARTHLSDRVLEDPKIALWISTNPIYEPSERFMIFPAGFSPFNLSLYTNILLNKEIIKTNEVAHMHLASTNPCRELLPKVDRCSEEEFYDTIRKSKFIISPIGDRDDCYRHYECIGLKTIPISNVGEYYKGLFKDNMLYCDIQKMIEIIQTNEVNREYNEPDQNLISYEYHKDLVYDRIQSIRKTDIHQ